MDKEVLEVALKRFARECKIQRVLDVEAGPAVPKGENYCSEILRLRTKVVLGNGRLAYKNFIMKKLHTKDSSGKWAKQNRLAEWEAHIYSVVIKEMSYLMEEFDDTEEPLWCKFYHFDRSAPYLLFEDLKAIGYRMVPRQEVLDLDHALLALRGLARYHAMAKVLEERGVVCRDQYCTAVLLRDGVFIDSFCYNGLRHTAKAVREHWGPGWEEVTEKLLNIQRGPLADKLMSIVEPKEAEFNVLNHGDCWSNNLMFKYDWQNRPIAVKFVDYQVPNYNSPCSDISNFIYLSIQPPVRRQNYRLLLQSYHDCLLSSLDRFGFSGTRPTLEEIVSAMERFEFFGLVSFLNGFPMIICKSAETFDLEVVLESRGEEGFSSQIYKEPGIREKVAPDLLDFVNKYLPIV